MFKIVSLIGFGAVLALARRGFAQQGHGRTGGA